MAKATGKKPTENTYSLLFDQEGGGSKSAKAKKVDPVPAVEEAKKVAEKQQPPKKQPSKAAEPTATAAPATDAAAPKSKLNREEWDKNKGQIQQENNDGFQPARPPKQYNNQQSAQTGQNYGQENFRGGRGGGEYRGGRRGRGGDYQGGRGGDYQGGRGGDYQGGRGGYYQGGRGGEYQGGRGGEYQGGRGGDYQGGRGGEYQGGRGGEYQGGRGGDYQGGGQGEYQGGGRRGGGDYRGGRRGRGGRGRNPNRNLEDQPAVEENSNRDVNQRGEDLTGDKTPRKRQNDRRSGRFVKNYGNNNTGPEFAPPEWTSANLENAPATTEPTTTAEGWGDTANTTEESAAWDAVNQATAQTAPAQVQTAETKSAAKKPEKPKPVPQKGLDDYLGEKEKKKQELADLLASKGVNVPTPKAPAVVEEPKPTKTKQTAKPSGAAAPETLFFNFEANRSPRFNQDSDLPDDPPPGYENTSRGRGGRRGGRGGRFQGGRYNRNNNYGETAAAVVAAQPTQYYDASSVAREDEWPSLI